MFKATWKRDLSEMNKRIKVSSDFQEQLKMVFNNYISLKDALVKDDSKKVSEDAKALLYNLGQIDMKLLGENSSHSRWMSLRKRD